MTRIKSTLLALIAILLAPLSAYAVPINFSFSGSFDQDDDVQLFGFSADGTSEVFLVSVGYGGGTQADGTVFADGGFDTILSLFDGSGNLIALNDDGSLGCFADAGLIGGSYGNASAISGQRWDTCLSAVLTAGDYLVAVTQYNNFANGPTLSAGFRRDGEGNFTAQSCSADAFCDVAGTSRTNEWAFDILNVESAALVPEPGTLALFGIGLLGIGAARRRKRA